MRRFAFVALVALALPTPAVLAAPPETKAKVGAYYFDGWTGRTFHITDRLKSEFADREPVWGWKDDTVEILERQVDIAADAGLSFFSFCWYWPEGPDKHAEENSALELFHGAKNRDRMEFCLLVANHGGFRIGPKDWDQASEVWIREFQRPNHLKVDGKPVVIFFSNHDLLQAFGGPEAVRKAFDGLRERAKSAGLAGVSIGLCATPGPDHGWNDLGILNACGPDFLTGYNYVGAGRKGPELRRPFAELVDGNELVWDGFAKRSPLPYVPVATIGWDKRPWEKADDPKTHAVYYDDRTPEAVGDAVARGVRWLDRHPARTLPDRLLLLYAWNENGEGGFLTPTKAAGPAVLNAVKQAIARP